MRPFDTNTDVLGVTGVSNANNLIPFSIKEEDD